MKDQTYKVVNFSLPEEDYEALRLYCFLSRLPMAEFVRRATIDRLERVQRGNSRQEPEEEQEEQQREAS